MMDLVTQHAAAYRRGVVIPRPAVGHIWSTGATRVDLIHRMSTNDLNNLQPGEGRATVLTNAVARMVDRVVVLNLGERALLVTSAGRATAVRAWLSRYIFFNDDIKLTDAGETLTQFDVYGPQSATWLSQWLPSAAALPLHHGREIGEGLWLMRTEALAGMGFAVIGAPAALAEMQAQLVAQGAVVGDETLREVLRVEAGVPGPEGEVNDQYIPLEADLWGDVSFQKGCYIGQEIIARMESRGRLAKTLVAVQAAGAVRVGMALRGPGGERGTLTSAVESPALGWIGLGFIKPSAAESGTLLMAEDEAGAVSVQVVATPMAVAVTP